MNPLGDQELPRNPIDIGGTYPLSVQRPESGCDGVAPSGFPHSGGVDLPPPGQIPGVEHTSSRRNAEDHHSTAGKIPEQSPSGVVAIRFRRVLVQQYVRDLLPLLW